MEPRSTPNRYMLKRILFLCAVILLVAVIIFLSARAFLAGATPEKGGSGIADGAVSSADDGKIVINDLYEGEITIPRFDIGLNNYKAEQFLNDQGVIRYDSEDARLGLDVSEFQGDIDWPMVKASGIDFVIIRAGYRGATRGKLNEDAKFAQNYEGATAAGIQVGVYFFSQATSDAEADEEASYMLQLLQGKTLQYPVVFDWEPQERTSGVNGEQMTSFAATFCRKLQQAGFTSAVYFNRSQAYTQYNLEQLSGFDFWLAEYRDVPAFYYNFDIWQYSDNAQVQGIDSVVDIDISFKKYG